MEVAAAVLPIVARYIGWVSEFIKHNENVKHVDMEDITSYTSAIESIVKNPHDTHKLIEETQKLLHSQHSWDTFNRRVKSDIV